MRERSARSRLAPHVSRVEQLYSEVQRRKRAPVLPSSPLDADLLAILSEQAREKARTEGEPIVYIQPRGGLGASTRGRAIVSRLRRVARALHLPKVFP
jgi:hypothetical protein